MNSLLVKNIVRFVLLVLFQVLLLNNMNLGGYLNPYVYVLFIILLPVNINKNLMLLLAFVMGMTIDYFGNTLGLHASASVFMAFVRPAVINLFFSNYEFGQDDEPGLSRLKFSGFFRYVFAMVFVHHFTLFLLEMFSLDNFIQTLYRIMLSSLLTILMSFVLMFLFSRKKS